MKQSSRLTIILTVLVLSIGCDQILKQVARTFLQYRPAVPLLDDFIRLQYAENSGVMLSIGASLSPELRFWIFVVVIGALLAAMLGYVALNGGMNGMQTVAWSLMVSGGLGNLVDRVFRGGVVVDFISIGFGVIRTAVFNLADLLVFVGVFLLLAFGKRKHEEPPTEATNG